VVGNRVFLNSIAQCACFGREKEASDLASKASADLSDFLALIIGAISVPFARENLHLVVFVVIDIKDPAALSPYSVVPAMARIVYAACRLVK
jgi:hypothetical protein